MPNVKTSLVQTTSRKEIMFNIEESSEAGGEERKMNFSNLTERAVQLGLRAPGSSDLLSGSPDKAEAKLSRMSALLDRIEAQRAHDQQEWEAIAAEE